MIILKWICLVGIWLILIGAGPIGVFEAQPKIPVDGDTVKFVNISYTCRLIGIDAPETPKLKYNMPGQPFGEQSQEVLSKMILQRNVTVLIYGADRYGRLLCWLLVDGISVNLEMVKEGFAEAYIYDPKTTPFVPTLNMAEQDAQNNKKGMWQQDSKKYESPSVYRKRMKDRDKDEE